MAICLLYFPLPALRPVLFLTAVLQGFSGAIAVGMWEVRWGVPVGTVGHTWTVLPLIPVTQPCCRPNDFSDWMATVIFRTCSALWTCVGLRSKSARSA